MKKDQSGELLIDLHYLPCLDYFAGLAQFERVNLEAHEQYQKQSYRNRCYVLTANKVDCLTVPVLNGTHKQLIREVRIDNSQPWPGRHWRCLRAAYGRAPFFEFYGPYLEPVYQKNWSFLFDLNYELLTICLQLLRLPAGLRLTEWYVKQPQIGVVDARSRLNVRKQDSEPLFYCPVPYSQNFGPDFVPNLSIVDLLFNQGPQAQNYLVNDRMSK